MPRPFLGPQRFLACSEAMSGKWGRAEALDYTRWLATRHYENFHVVSFLLPRRLRQDFFNVYAYCRWADDLADETGSPRESLRLLKWWREELDNMYAGRAAHPVFVALMDTVQAHSLPSDPFRDLLAAFEQDQMVAAYRDWDELFAYCRNSANPVGRLLLHLCGYSDAARLRLSDATCTALQLANFWQDVTVDLAKGRVYIPLDAMARHGYGVEQLRAGEFNAAFENVMRDLVDVTRGLFMKGLPLAGMVDRRLAIDIELFSRGGMRVLEKIERQSCDVLSRRPAISKFERAGLLAAAIFRHAFSRAAAA